MNLLPIKNKEVLGLNRRNQKYIRPLNPLKAKIIADNKLLTKRVLNKLGIKTPEIYKVIRSKVQLDFIDWSTLPKSFVVKPNRGSLGSGILVFYGQKKGQQEWIKPNGQSMDIETIKLHISKILEGQFSMGNAKDICIIEERIQNDKVLKRYSYKGVPDVRIIVYNKVPVMAMVRFPTKRSDGKANLHAGGICTGIDMAAGITTTSMQMKSSSLLEDTYEDVEFTSDLKENLPLSGVKVPYWDEILEIAIKCQMASGLGYLGVDVALDRNKGPVVFEINARPGLGIQTANNAGLRARLERVEGLKIKSIKHGIRVAKNLFGGEIEDEVEVMTGKQIVNLVENITIYHKRFTKGIKKPKIKEKKELVKAMMDTGITTSRIDRGLAQQIGYSEAYKHFRTLNVPKRFETYEEADQYINSHENEATSHPDIVRFAKISEEGIIRVRPVIKVEVKIGEQTKEVEAIISKRTDMIYQFLVGRAELKNYLIDASKTFTK
ncbi:MAG: hypothetical protein Fur003_2810 [Candidatus Dojkabacteria bacterium]